MTVIHPRCSYKTQLLAFFIIFAGLSFSSCSRQLVNIEANNRCKCIKRVTNEIQSRARKSEAQGRKSSWSNPSYVKGVLKAGSEDCAALRRKSEHRGIVARMTREERAAYDAQVLEIMQRKCRTRLEKVQN